MWLHVFIVFNTLCSAKRDGLCCELLDCVESVSIYWNDLVSVLIIIAVKRHRIAKAASSNFYFCFFFLSWTHKKTAYIIENKSKTVISLIFHSFHSRVNLIKQIEPNFLESNLLVSQKYLIVRVFWVVWSIKQK